MSVTHSSLSTFRDGMIDVGNGGTCDLGVALDFGHDHTWISRQLGLKMEG